MPTNDFLPFGVAAGANVSTQSEYSALAARSNGFSAGTAVSKQLNKAWRQSSVMSYALAQFIANTSNTDVLDDGNPSTILGKLAVAIATASQNAGTIWSNVSNKPTTISGYGITDAYTKSQVDTALAAKPNGDNAITVGFVSGAKTAPYIQHTDTTVVRLANQATTLAGYGITDAYTKTLSDARYPFSDNALTIGFVSSDVTKPYIQSKTDNNIYRLQPLLGQATESTQGTVAIATQAVTNAGTDDAGAITAKKLKFGFASLLSANGYLKFPDWLGGFIIQWGNASIGDDTIVDVTLPISFPNSFFAAIATAQINAAVTGSNSLSATAYKKSLSTVTVGMNQGSTSTPATSGVDYICIGR